MKPWSGRSKNTSDLMAMTGGREGGMEGRGGGGKVKSRAIFGR